MSTASEPRIDGSWPDAADTRLVTMPPATASAIASPICTVKRSRPSIQPMVSEKIGMPERMTAAATGSTSFWPQTKRRAEKASAREATRAGPERMRATMLRVWPKASATRPTTSPPISARSAASSTGGQVLSRMAVIGKLVAHTSMQATATPLPLIAPCLPIALTAPAGAELDHVCRRLNRLHADSQSGRAVSRLISRMANEVSMAAMPGMRFITRCMNSL